jgi:hypothetical protein
MTSTTTASVASNGGDTTAHKHVPVQREHGINRLREEECYHLTSLVGDCLDEAEHLVRKVHNKAYSRVIDHDGSKGTKPLDRDDINATLQEAYDCTSLALAYLFSVSTHLRDHNDEVEPAF